MGMVENVSSQESNEGKMLSTLIHSQTHVNREEGYHHHDRPRSMPVTGGEEGFKKEMRDLEEMFSKLNPMAKEFVPNYTYTSTRIITDTDGYYAENVGAANFMYPNRFANNNNNGYMDQIRKKSGYNQNKKKMSSRTRMSQYEDVIRRTVYIPDIDHQITEEKLAALFLGCGQVVDCRVCGDPKSVLRFAFVEFTDEEAVQAAINLSGTILGYYPVKVLPSKTAIAPVNPTLLPQTEDEREKCARTVYVANIDKKVVEADIKLFFESVCGEVYCLRLLGGDQHSAHIAFVEFAMAESAIAALNCSGVILGTLPIRVSPSKTPVRLGGPRPSTH